ncbi:MAG: DMT family transporter [Alphaproteobacteria bacterium]|nr:DMT family transporter [Alphaproteobacteria bacterium]
MATRALQTGRPSWGILLKLGATLSFSLMYVAVRLAGPVPVGQVVFFRAFFALIPLFCLAVFTVGPAKVFRTGRLRLHIFRSLTGIASMFLNFAAIKLLPLAELTGLGFAMPIFAVVLAAILLGEHVGPWRAIAVVIGFAGVVLMTAHHNPFQIAGLSSAGAGLALLAALLSAFVVIFIRQMSITERSETIVFYFMVLTALAGAVTMLRWSVPLTIPMLFWLVLCGFLGGIGQICMTYSYRFAEPSLLAPFDYVAMVWASMFGLLVFGEWPERGVLLGGAIVVGSGVFIAWRERRLQRSMAAAGSTLAT